MFIKLTRLYKEREYVEYVNASCIQVIDEHASKNSNGVYTHVHFDYSNGKYMIVKETPEEILSLINKHKGN